VAENDPHLTQGDVRFEPRHALVSGEDGLDCIRELVCDAHNYLVDGGYLLLEHGFDQGEAVRRLLKDNDYHTIHTIHDLAGNERLTMARWKQP
jgi:release factor glutamine methyltransferase